MTATSPAFETTLRHGETTVTLRGSLRAAVRLAAYETGIGGLIEALAGASLTAIRFVISASAPRPEAEAFLGAVQDQPLHGFQHSGQAAGLALIHAILPKPVEGAESTTKTAASTTPAAKAKPWAEYYSDLYSYATGWLSWTPTETWNASPQEIEASFRAHTDRLIAMNGGSDDSTDTPRSSKPSKLTQEERQANIDQGLDPEFDRAGLARLRSMMGG